MQDFLLIISPPDDKLEYFSYAELNEKESLKLQSENAKPTTTGGLLNKISQKLASNTTENDKCYKFIKSIHSMPNPQYSLEELRKLNYFGDKIKPPNNTTPEKILSLVKANYNLKDLKYAGYTVTNLVSYDILADFSFGDKASYINLRIDKTKELLMALLNTTNTDSTDLDIDTVKHFRNIGYRVRDFGAPIIGEEEMQNVGNYRFTASILKAGGYTIENMSYEKINPKFLNINKAFTLKEIKGKYKLEDMLNADSLVIEKERWKGKKKSYTPADFLTTYNSPTLLNDIQYIFTDTDKAALFLLKKRLSCALVSLVANNTISVDTLLGTYDEDFIISHLSDVAKQLLSTLNINTIVDKSSLEKLKAAHFTPEDLKKADITAKQLLDAKYTLYDLYGVYDISDLKNAEIPLKDILCNSKYNKLVTDIQRHYTAAKAHNEETPLSMKDQNNDTVVLTSFFNFIELLDAGYSLDIVLPYANIYPLSDKKPRDSLLLEIFDPNDTKKHPNPTLLKALYNVTALHLKPYKYNAEEMHKFGYTAGELKKAKYTILDLYPNKYNKGFYNIENYDPLVLSYTAKEMYDGEYTLQELMMQDMSYNKKTYLDTLTKRETLKYFHTEATMPDKYFFMPYELPELLKGGYTLLDILNLKYPTLNKSNLSLSEFLRRNLPIIEFQLIPAQNTFSYFDRFYKLDVIFEYLLAKGEITNPLVYNSLISAGYTVEYIDKLNTSIFNAVLKMSTYSRELTSSARSFNKPDFLSNLLLLGYKKIEIIKLSNHVDLLKNTPLSKLEILKKAGYTITDLKSAGITLENLLAVFDKNKIIGNYSLVEINTALLIDTSLPKLEILKKAGYTITDFKLAGISLEKLLAVFKKTVITENYTLAEINEALTKNNVSELEILIKAGYTITDFKLAGIDITLISELSSITYTELLASGYNYNDIKALPIETIKKLKVPLSIIKEWPEKKYELKGNYTIDKIRKAGYTLKEMVDKMHYTVKEIKNDGIGALEFYIEEFYPTDLTTVYRRDDFDLDFIGSKIFVKNDILLNGFLNAGYDKDLLVDLNSQGWFGNKKTQNANYIREWVKNPT